MEVSWVVLRRLSTTTRANEIRRSRSLGVHCYRVFRDARTDPSRMTI